MAYTQNTWANGDVITADKLNNMEAGIQEALGGGSGNVSSKTILNIEGMDKKEWEEMPEHPTTFLAVIKG